MAYVYRHIRSDRNVPFYIGMGSQDNYSRAYTKQNRNRHWHNIAKKAGYEVEIIFDGLAWEQAQEKEMEFIALYRREEHGGILCNLTDGGGGAIGLITSEETKKKQSLKKIGKPPSNKGVKQSEEAILKNRLSHLGQKAWNKGIPNSPEKRKRHSEIMKGRVSTFKGRRHTEESNNKNRIAHLGKTAWNKGLPMSKEQKAYLKQFTKGHIPWNKGIPQSEETKRKMMETKRSKVYASTKGRKLTPEHITKMALSKIRTVYQFTLEGEFVAMYDCAQTASEKTGLKTSSIAASCRKKFGNRQTNIHGGFKWGYEKSL